MSQPSQPAGVSSTQPPVMAGDRPDMARRGAKKVKGSDTPTGLLAKQRIIVKRWVTSMWWEMGMLAVVLVYFVVVFGTFAISDQKALNLPPTAPSWPRCH